MLLEIAQWLAKDVRVFNVFNYITLRAVLACLTALAVSLILGPYMIRKLTAYKIGQAVREEGPRSHLTKAGTPTMGGALILVSIWLTTLLWGDLSNRLLWVVLLVTLAYGTIGWIADYRTVAQHDPKGLSAKAKFFWQRSEEHTSELQSLTNLVCRLLLEKKKETKCTPHTIQQTATAS